MYETSERPGVVDPGAAFAKLVQAARKRAGLSQERAAELAGINRGTLIRWEGGNAKSPDAAALKSVCSALCIDRHDALRALGYLDDLQVAA